MAEVEESGGLAWAPPCDLDAEEAVVGSLLLDPRRLDEIAAVIAPDDIYREATAAIYRGALALQARAAPIDAITVAAELEARGQLEQVGGRARLALLVEATPTAANAAHYARLVKACAGRRTLLELGRTLCQLSQDPGLNLAGSISAAHDQLDRIQCEPFQMAALPAVVGDAVARLRDRWRHRPHLKGVASGLDDLDQVIGGLQRGQLIVLASPDAEVSSSLGLELIRNASLKQKVAAAIFCPGRDVGTVTEELVCAEAGIAYRVALSGLLTDSEAARLDEVAGALSQAPVVLDERPQLGTGQVREELRRLRRTMEIGLVVVDGFDHVEPAEPESENGRPGSRRQIARTLKSLAREHQVAVVVTARLCRAADSSTAPYGSLTDLDEGLEEHADVVLLLHRSSGQRLSSGSERLMIEVAKHRYGPTARLSVEVPARADVASKPEQQGLRETPYTNVAARAAAQAAAAGPPVTQAPARDNRHEERVAYYKSRRDTLGPDSLPRATVTEAQGPDPLG